MTQPTQPASGGKLVWVAALGGFVTLLAPLFIGTVNKWESSGKTVLVVYADKLAEGLPTVCDGLTRHVTKTPIIVGEKWTQEKCEREQYAAMEAVQRQLLPCFKILPPPSVLDMASSHAWNHGAGATCTSLAMEAWNRGDWELGCRRISKSDAGRPVWSSTSKIVNGKKVYTYVQGLANRKEDETKQCLEGLQ